MRDENSPQRTRPYKPDQIRVEERNDWRRASHLAICSICGCEFIEHQPVTGYIWLTKLCDGRLVKL